MDKEAIKSIIKAQIDEIISYKKEASGIDTKDFITLHMQLASYLRDYVDLLD